MPFGMFEWSVDISPAAGGIYQDHQGHGGAAEDIEGVKSLIHFQGIDGLNVGIWVCNVKVNNKYCIGQH